MWWNFSKIIVDKNDGLPIDWNSMAQSGKIFIEIGFGNGEFLEYLAKTYTDTLIVGVEVSQWCAAKGARRALSQGTDNIRIMHGDARLLLRHCFAPETVARVFMNFPCPWPKTRHASRRVTVPAFAELLNYLLEPGGTFELATDVDWYAEQAAQTITANGAFEKVKFEINPERPYVTKYERKWKSMGKDTWGLILRKNGNVAAGECGEGDWPMEAETKTNKSIAELLQKINGASGAGTDGSGHWVFRDTYMSAEGVGLALVITADEGFEQHFYLKFIESRRGVTVVKVDSVGHPYRTPSMRAALLFALKSAK
jgi:tRNA (guanine-N7-)-methyltransferase